MIICSWHHKILGKASHLIVFLTRLINSIARKRRHVRQVSRDLTKPPNECAPSEDSDQLGIRPVWSESWLCAQWVAKDPSFLHAESEDSDQTGRMPRRIWVFAGRTVTLLFLPCRDSSIKLTWFAEQVVVFKQSWGSGMSTHSRHLLHARDRKRGKSVCILVLMNHECQGQIQINRSDGGTQLNFKPESFRIPEIYILAFAFSFFIFNLPIMTKEKSRRTESAFIRAISWKS